MADKALVGDALMSPQEGRPFLQQLDDLLAQCHQRWMIEKNTIYKAQVNILRALKENVTGEDQAYIPYDMWEMALRDNNEPGLTIGNCFKCHKFPCECGTPL